jgi:hypothetical protein
LLKLLCCMHLDRACGDPDKSKSGVSLLTGVLLVLVVPSLHVMSCLAATKDDSIWPVYRAPLSWDLLNCCIHALEREKMNHSSQRQRQLDRKIRLNGYIEQYCIHESSTNHSLLHNQIKNHMLAFTAAQGRDERWQWYRLIETVRYHGRRPS